MTNFEQQRPTAQIQRLKTEWELRLTLPATNWEGKSNRNGGWYASTVSSFSGSAIFAEDSSLCRTFTNSMLNFRRHRVSIKRALYMSDRQDSFCSSCASPSRAGNLALPQPQAGPAGGIANIKHFNIHFILISSYFICLPSQSRFRPTSSSANFQKELSVATGSPALTTTLTEADKHRGPQGKSYTFLGGKQILVWSKDSKGQLWRQEWKKAAWPMCNSPPPHAAARES